MKLVGKTVICPKTNKPIDTNYCTAHCGDVLYFGKFWECVYDMSLKQIDELCEQEKVDKEEEE